MLDGTRIIEVEGLGPGPFAGMMLADHGADVIVVHRKDAKLAPGYPTKSLLDRNKRSIALDLKDPDDVATFLKLVGTADALIEGFRPGVMERLDIGPAECHAINPRLVFGRMTGWGQEGHLARSAGHDMNYASLSGALWYASPPGAEPFATPTVLGDIAGGGLYLVIGILMGIMKARATGEGTVVDAAIVDGSANSLNLLMALAGAGMLSEERGQSLLDGPPWSRSYRCSDGGFMSVQCIEPQFYRQFLDLIGLVDHPDMAEQMNRRKWPQQSALVEQRFLTRTRDHWEKIFAGTDACVAPVLSPHQAARHGINADRGMWVEAFGLLQAMPAPRFSNSGPQVPTDPPDRGQHSAEILSELKSVAGNRG
ncbi:CaiB/BaiF CoA transferase family protein [Sedimentitalea arenosa]|uniref:CoA transferase n=1 Tax=Sedimentitalea arenosa TaxID=2798803 RepID=A0A8J7LSG1_9RHOB|nr:CaiB/BaiF CoA-transferase family protein [Arenibacterium arenosum]MBJ6371949.1 CoA transferase [Arenibacterium arenosum]